MVLVVVREWVSVLALVRAERALERVRRGRGPAPRALPLLLGELRQAVRRLRRSPAFTITAVVTLALAIGALVTIFTLVQRIVRNPLPYPDAGRLIALDHAGFGGRRGVQMSSGLYFQYGERARTLDGVALHWGYEGTLSGAGEPRRVRVSRGTPSLLSVLDIEPSLGRWFTETEARPGAPPVAVLTARLWREVSGGASALEGRRIVLDGVPHDVIGVLPAEFAFPDDRTELWLAAQLAPAAARAGGFNFAGVARLRGGATLEQTRAELNAIIADLPRAYPQDAFAPTVVREARLASTALPLRAFVVGDVADTLWVFFAAVALVLLIACANVANLFLVRSDVKQREIAVRRALGAGSRGVTGFFLAESLVLCALAALAGLGLAWIGVRLLVAFGPDLPRLHEVRIDAVVVVFACAVAALAAAVFAAIPLARGGGSLTALRAGGRSATGARSQLRLRHALMGGQVALALVLLVGAMLMVRSYRALRAVDPHFDTADALVFRLGLSRDYPTRAAAIGFYTRALDRIAAIPGVTGVSATTCVPLADEGMCYGDPIGVEGRPVAPGEIPPIVAVRAVAGDALEVLGVPLVRGRGIARADVEAAARVVVVDEALARVYFPEEDPLGMRVRLDFLAPDDPAVLHTIVGIARSTPTHGLTEPAPVPTLYLPLRAEDEGPSIGALSFVVRTGVPPLTVLPALRAVIAELDPALALARVRTLEDVLAQAGAPLAFAMALLLVAGAVAVLLGVVGIWGVIAYAVRQRTREIGVRLALGAAPRSVSGMIMRDGGRVIASGVLVGLVGVLLSARAIEALLFEVHPRDPAVLAGVSALLVTIALLACWLPARRAATLRPTDAMRED